jgi:RimJ/RimL family protein N-acetyltransferase
MLNWRPGQPVRLFTKRFQLATLTAADATPQLLSWVNDPELMRFLNGPRNLPNLQALVQYIARHDNRRDFWFGIRREGRLVGFLWVDVAEKDRNARTHHLIGDKRLWGSHAALEARAAVLDFLFGTAGMERIAGSPRADCRAAIMGYLKQGFIYEGTFKSAMRGPDGTRHDMCFLRLLPEEWAAFKAANGSYLRRPTPEILSLMRRFGGNGDKG